jgi:23S rRNA (cytosine1962-C5)-methyltransferase
MQTTLLNTLHFPEQWEDYRLIDCGEGKKLEQFGSYILIRPEPQAIWPAKLAENRWREMAHAAFIRKGDGKSAMSEGEGGWSLLKKMPQEWDIRYTKHNTRLRARLKMTGFGHVGIFPEQKANWDYLLENLQAGDKMLNLFAYTGMSTLAAASAKAQATHIDSVKNVVSWARDNAELSQLGEVRWIVEDAFKFAQREVNRGNTYDCIVLDPPAYGRGPKGEKWVLEDTLPELMTLVQRLLKPNGKLILNLYSLGYTPLLCHNLLSAYFPGRKIESGTLALKSESGFYLPLSVYGKLI